MLRVIPIPALRDNYAYLVVALDGATAVVDPSEARPVKTALAANGLTLSQIWLTHHHWDHVGGIDELCDAFSPKQVLGSLHDLQERRIPRQTTGFSEGDTFELGGHRVQVIENPGHTLGAISYLVEGELFTGDTLFVAGCGRVFEGTMAMMRDSLAKLRSLPDETRIYCGHEYTVRNLEFAVSIEPDNTEVRAALAEARSRHLQGEPTVPTTLGIDRRVNPFLRFDDPALAKGRSEVATFTSLREQKDRF